MNPAERRASDQHPQTPTVPGGSAGSPGSPNNKYLNPNRPKITITMPKSMYHDNPNIPNAGSPYYQTVTGEMTANIGGSIYHPDNTQGAPTWPMYISNGRAGEFMFKQFEGFRDFTMTTAKSGLSVGEKSVFWLYEKFSKYSKRWFTHFFLLIIMLLYSALGALIFVKVEGGNAEQKLNDLVLLRRETSQKLRELAQDRELLLDVEQWEGKSNNLLKMFQDTVINTNAAVNNEWTFRNAMLYCGTIYTTIETDEDADD